MLGSGQRWGGVFLPSSVAHIVTLCLLRHLGSFIGYFMGLWSVHRTWSAASACPFIPLFFLTLCLPPAKTSLCSQLNII